MHARASISGCGCGRSSASARRAPPGAVPWRSARASLRCGPSLMTQSHLSARHVAITRDQTGSRSDFSWLRRSHENHDLYHGLLPAAAIAEIFIRDCDDSRQDDSGHESRREIATSSSKFRFGKYAGALSDRSVRTGQTKVCLVLSSPAFILGWPRRFRARCRFRPNCHGDDLAYRWASHRDCGSHD